MLLHPLAGSVFEVRQTPSTQREKIHNFIHVLCELNAVF